MPRIRKEMWSRMLHRSIILILAAAPCWAASANFNIVDYGAKNDGSAPATEAFRRAIQAAKAAGGGDRKALRDALAKIKNLDTVLGRFSFTEGRDADHAGIVQEIKGGKFVVLGN